MKEIIRNYLQKYFFIKTSDTITIFMYHLFVLFGLTSSCSSSKTSIISMAKDLIKHKQRIDNGGTFQNDIMKYLSTKNLFQFFHKNFIVMQTPNIYEIYKIPKPPYL